MEGKESSFTKEKAMKKNVRGKSIEEK